MTISHLQVIINIYIYKSSYQHYFWSKFSLCSVQKAYRKELQKHIADTRKSKKELNINVSNIYI